MVPNSSVDFITESIFETLVSEWMKRVYFYRVDNFEENETKNSAHWVDQQNKPFGQISVNFVNSPKQASTDSTTLWCVSMGSRIFMHRFESASINPMDTAKLKTDDEEKTDFLAF